MTLPKIKQLPRPQVSGLPAIISKPQLYNIPTPGKPVYRYTPKEYESKVFDYNSTTEVNSFADVLWRYLDRVATTKDESFLKSISDVLPFEMLKDTVTLGKGVIAPITDGGWKTGRGWQGMGINVLNNAMETLDIIANPAKGFWMDGFEGVKNATVGRVNYDFDTGSWVSDVGLELVVDPINWATLGGKAMVTGLAKGAGRAAAKEFGSELSAKAVKKIAGSFARGVTSSGDDLLATVARKSLVKGMPEAVQQKLQKTLVHNMNIKLITSLNKLGKVADAIDSAFLQSALLFMPKTLGAISRPVFNYVNETTNRVLKKHTPADIPSTMYNLSDAMPDLVKEFNSLQAVDGADLRYLDPSAVINRVAINDRKIISNIISTNYKNTNNIMQATVEWTKAAGTTWDDYRNVVANFADSNPDLAGVLGLASYVNAIDSLFKASNIAQNDYRVVADMFINDFTSPLSTLLETTDIADKELGYFTGTEDSIHEVMLKLRRLYQNNPDMHEVLDSLKYRERLDELLSHNGLKTKTLEARLRNLKTFSADVVQVVQDYQVNLQDAQLFRRDFEVLRAKMKSAKEVVENLGSKNILKQTNPTEVAGSDVVASDMIKQLDAFKKESDQLFETYLSADQGFSLAYDVYYDELLNTHTAKEYADIAEDFMAAIDQQLNYFKGQITDTKGNNRVVLGVDSPLGLHDEDLLRSVNKIIDEFKTNALDGDIEDFVKIVKVEQQYKDKLIYGAHDTSEFAHAIDSLEALYDSVKASIKESVFTEPLVSVDDDVKRYVLKYSQVASNLELYATEGLSELTQAIETFDDLGSTFNLLLTRNVLTPDQKLKLSNAMVMLSGIGKVRDMYSSVLASKTLDDTARYSTLDALQSFARVKMTKVLDEPDKYKYIIKKKINDNISANVRTKRYSLESYAKRYQDEFGAWIKEKYPDITDTNHAADYDVALTTFIAEEKLNLDISEMVIFDLETSGLNKSDANQIVQIAYRLPSTGEIVKINVKPDAALPPKPSVMRKLLGPEAEGIRDTKQLTDMYINRFSKDAISEKEALTLFRDVVNQTRTDLGKLSLAGHNIKGFDLGMLRNRFAFHELPQITNVYKLDTLEEAFKKDGIKQLTAEQSDELDKIIDRYIASKSHDMTFKMQVEGMKQGIFGQDQRLFDSRFIQDAGGDLAQSLRDVSEAIDRGVKTTSDTGEYMLHTQLARKLGQTSQHLYESLKGIGGFNKTFSKTHIDSDKLHLVFPGMAQASQEVIDEFMELNNVNITKLLNKINVKNGAITGLQPVAAKTLYDTKLIKDYFQKITGDYTPNSLGKLHQASKIMERYSTRIMKLEELSEAGIPRLEEAFNYLKSRIPAVYKNNYIPVEISELVFNKNDLRMAYAQTLYMFHRMKKLINDDALLKRVIPADDKVLQYLWHPEALTGMPHRKFIYFSEYDRLESYFKMNHYDDSFITGESMAHAHRQDPYKNLDHIIDTLSEDGIYTARQFSNASMLRNVQSNFSEMVDEVSALRALETTEADKQVDALYRALDNVDSVVSGHQLTQVMRLTPQQMKEYLWNDALGLVVIPRQDHIGFHKELDKFMLPGVATHVDEKNIIIYLTEEFDEFDLGKSYKFSDVDIDVSNKYVNKLIQDRHEVLLKTPDGIGTSLEIIGRKTFDDAVGLLPDNVLKDIISPTTLDQHHRFVGTTYNKSFLGSNVQRRSWLPYTYNNPYKNVYAAAQQVMRVGDTQTKYMAMMFDSSVQMNSDMFSEFSDQELFETLQGNKALHVGALVKDEKLGAMVKRIKIRTVKDITEARRLNSVVVPAQFLNKASNVINDAKLTSSLMQMLNKWVVGVTKTGQLTSLGFLLRNLYDSTTKNVISAASPRAITNMYTTGKLYHEYTEILKKKLTYKVFDDDLFFDLFKEELQLDKGTYQLIHDFINDGASAGLTKATQDELSNVYKTLHLKSRHQDVLTWEQIRDFIEQPKLRNPEAYSPEVYRDLLRLEGEKEIFAKAHAMASHTRKTGLNVTTIATYLKRPDRIPAELREEFMRIKKYKPAWKTMRTVERTVFENPLSKMVMSTNNYAEQIFRLSNYLDNIQYKGMNVPEAMAEMVKFHFDTVNKTQKQLYLEMILPFSTFSFRNLALWAELVEDSPGFFRYARDIMAPSIDLGDYTPWDLENRMSLQYHILSGNQLIDEDSGLTVKLSPSMMDAFSYFYDPVNTLTGKLVPVIRTPLEVVFDKKEPWMDQEYFDESRRNALIGAIPGVGPAIYRGIRGDVHAERTGSQLPKMMSSVFGSVNLPKKIDKPKYRRWYAQSQKYTYYSNRYNGFSKTYVPYASKPIAYNRARYYNPTPTLASRRVNRHVKRDMFTATGKARLSLMMIPPRPGSAKYALNNIWRKWSI